MLKLVLQAVTKQSRTLPRMYATSAERYRILKKRHTDRTRCLEFIRTVKIHMQTPIQFENETLKITKDKVIFKLHPLSAPELIWDALDVLMTQWWLEREGRNGIRQVS